MLNLKNISKMYGFIIIPFEYIILIENLQKAAEAEGHYLILKEKTGLFTIRAKDTGHVIAKIKTKNNICERIYFDQNWSWQKDLGRVEEFDNKLSEIVKGIQPTTAPVPQKQEGLDELLGEDTIKKIEKLGTKTYATSKDALVIALNKKIHLKTITYTDESLLIALIKREASVLLPEEFGINCRLERNGPGRYLISKRGSGTVAVLNCEKAEFGSMLFPKVSKNKDFIKNFINKLAEKARIR